MPHKVDFITFALNYSLMKKLTLLFLVFILKLAPAKAQWVTIPDSNFVT